MQTEDIDAGSQTEALRLTSEIVAAFLSNNKIAPEQLSEFIKTIHRTLIEISRSVVETQSVEKAKPAVPVNKSVHNDYIVCLEDGKKLKMLKRYLRSTYGLSPDDYRRRWGLPPDYPMVAPSYAARRSEFAKSIGLGKGVRRKEP